MDNTIDENATDNLPATVSPQKLVADRGKKAIVDIGAELRRSKLGAPTVRTEAIVQEILDRLSCGESLTSITAADHMPAHSTMYLWISADPELDQAIARASAFGQRVLIDATLDIAAGGRFSTNDPRRDELLIKAINHVASKRNRAEFGEKLQVDARVINITLDKRETDW